MPNVRIVSAVRALDSPAFVSSCVVGQPEYLLLRHFPGPDIEKMWQEFESRLEFPDLYSSPHYFLEPHWKGKNPFAILVINGGRVTASLTGVDGGREVICGLPSRPQVSIDFAAESENATETLAKALVTEFPRARLIVVYSWSNALAPQLQRQHFRARQLEGDVVLDLRAGPGALFQSFHDNRKRNIRTAIRRGVEICEVNTAQDLADYWNVFCAWLKTERKTIHAETDLAIAAEIHRLRDTHRRFLARYEGKAIASTTVRFYPGGLIEYSANCSIDEFNALRPNDLLIWKTIQWACDHGFSRYSLGAAHPFLKKSGGVICPIYRYRLDRTFLHHVEISEKATQVGRHFLHRLELQKSVTIKRLIKRLAA